ncbi:alpha-protein kinase 3 isoform X1 [Pogona vitticeps]
MMGSRRRPLGRSYSGNGPFSAYSPGPGSDGEDNGPLGEHRPERRNYLLSVRPENSLPTNRLSPSNFGRSTFCAIIAQLTEETQPLFETTLKSYAVSEDADAKFTCVVTGYPQPEVTWYKDEEEMDRYCGLPKYQIFRHGNRHTLQLYKCTEDDAAIYQASARNSKGIVSCSGVLEVGTMTEYKIHQRWFARLKRNAEAKLREIEQSRKRGKENVEMEQLRRVSPDRFQRKRRLTGEVGMRSGASLWDKEEVAKVRIPDGKSRFGEGDHPTDQEPPLNTTALFSKNFISGRMEGEVTANVDASLENGEPNGEENANGFLSYIYEAVEKMKTKPTNKEYSAKKKKKKEEKASSSPNAPWDASQQEGGKQQRRNVAVHQGVSPVAAAQSASPVANGELTGAEIKEPSCQATERPASLPPAPSSKDGIYFSLKDMYFDSEKKPELKQEMPEVKLVRKKADEPSVAVSVPEETLPKTSMALKTAVLGERKNESCAEREEKEKEAVQIKSATLPFVETLGDPNATSFQHLDRSAEPAKEAQEGAAPFQRPNAAKMPDKSPSRTDFQHPNETLDPGARAPSPFPKENRTRLLDGHIRETDLLDSFPTGVETAQHHQSPFRGDTGINPAQVSQGAKQDLQEAALEEQLYTQGPCESPGNLAPVVSPDYNLQTPVSNLREEKNHEGGCITLRTSLLGERETKGSEESAGASPEAQDLDEVAGLGQEDKQDVSVASQNPPSVSLDVSQPIGKEELLVKGDVGRHSPRFDNGEIEHRPTPGHRSEELVTHGLPFQEAVLEERPTDPFDRVVPQIEIVGEEEIAEVSQDNKPGLETGSGLEGERFPAVTIRPLALPDVAVETSFPGHIPPAMMPPPSPTALQEPQRPAQFSPVKEGFAERNQSVAHLVKDVRRETEDQSSVTSMGGVPEQLIHRTAAEEVCVEEKTMGPPEVEGDELEAFPLGKKAEIQMQEREETTSEGPSAPEAAMEEEEEVVQKAQHKNLVSSLKNYLLLLLKMSTEPDKKKGKAKQEAKVVEETKPPSAIPKHVADVGIAGLTPRTSRKIFERVETNQLFQSAESLQLTPRTSRKLTGMINQELLACKESLVAEPEAPALPCVPSIVVGSASAELAGPSEPSPEISGEAVAALPSATPQELALGARRKIFLPKAKQADEMEEGMGLDDPAPRAKRESPTVSPKQGRRSTALLPAPGPASPPAERRSPTQARKMATLEVPKMYEEPAEESKEVVAEDSLISPENLQGIPQEGQGGETRKTNDPFKAPQVIRKIRAEQFSDASGNLKLWCQFFNILSDSKLTWYKDEVPVADVRRSAGDEGQAALAIVQVSQKDCGVYQCAIQNEYGTDTTDFLLSAEVLSGFIFKEEIEAGEEIEMTPMVFAKGLADSGFWGDKLFGRIMMEDLEAGQGFLRKACRARAIYGLEPVFESGHTGIIKVHNLIAFGGRSESTLVERNYDITIQECKIQNSSREYCKIFAAEARAVPDFGPVPEIMPLYLIYRPANNIPYATMEEDLPGQFELYCRRERDGSGLAPANPSEVGQKCCTFQHWLYQWTNGNILVTDLEGVGWKVTNVRIATKTKGYQGLKESCCPNLLDHFAASHQCNRYCELLALKGLEVHPPAAKVKGSRSPITGRKSSSAQSSPQLQKKGLASPQPSRKGSVSPKSARRGPENTTEPPSAPRPKGRDNGRAGRLQ